MKIFIDFDDVILNTKQFNAELRSFFASNGVSSEVLQKHYYDPADNNPVKLFDPEGVISRLEEHEKIDGEKMRKNFGTLLQDLSSYVFDDVKDFLNFAGKENVFLISFGLPTFQNEKIVACGVHNLVSGCVVTKGSKSEAISQVIEKVGIDSSEEIFFIDDRVEQVQDIKKAFPSAHTFLLCRKEGRYCDQKNDYCDYEIHNLKEAQEIISNFF